MQRVWFFQLCVIGCGLLVADHGRATAADLPLGDLGLVLVDELTFAKTQVKLEKLPAGLRLERELGIVVAPGVTVKQFYARPKPEVFAEAPRALKTPGGDWLVIFAAGKAHTIGAKSKINDLIARRSSDGGVTWSKPAVAWPVPYNQHAFNPLVPRGSRRIYSFQQESRFGDLEGGFHSGPLGRRHSDDDGRTWSQPTMIRPANDPDYKGVCHMQGCELPSGVWLLPTYTPTRINGVRMDRQYVLRSDDQGETWELLPGKRPSGWIVAHSERLLEGEIVPVGGKSAVMFSRESAGHLWIQRSDDDGQTWTDPAPTPLVHPDAPPMVFPLGDGRTLAAFIHNRKPTTPRQDFFPASPDRRDLWVSLSRNGAKTWTEPRFLACDATRTGDGKRAELSYGHLLIDGENLHFFADHQKRQIVHLQLRVDDLERLPTIAELTAAR